MSSLVFLVSEKLHSESAENSRITGFYNLTEFSHIRILHTLSVHTSAGIKCKVVDIEQCFH